MTLRKLSAAVLASVVASGAMAQDNANTTINYTVTEAVSVFSQATIDASSATAIGICVEYNGVSNILVSATTANNFKFSDGTNDLTYEIGNASDNTTDKDVATIANANTELDCADDHTTGGQSVSFTLGSGSIAAGSYSDTVTFTVGTI